jgi:hypothetical protein
MLSEDTRRPIYYDGQYLTPDDFVAEDRYQTDLRHRLSLAQHTWGIFVGLELTEQTRPGSTTTVDIVLSPGFATDGFGREVIAFEPFKLDAGLFLQPTQPAGWIPVWIRYLAEPTTPAQYGYEVCDDPNAATRMRETYTIEVGDKAKPDGDIQIDGTVTAESDIDLTDVSVPYQALPQDADDDRWLIPLGYVNWDGVSGFVPSVSDDDRKQRAKGRRYGGVVAAHAYSPDDTWELATRHLVDPTDPNPPRAQGFVRGTLTVEDLAVVENQGVELWASPLTLLDKDGKDQSRPLVLSRDDHVASADLRIKIGSDSSGKNRLVVDAAKTERFVVHDSGDVEVAGDLKVDGIVDLTDATDDRIWLGETRESDDTAAIGTESGGDIVYERAKSGVRWYVGKKPDAGASARLALDFGGLSIAGDALIGWRTDGRLKVRRIDGKDYKSDADDDLYLQWDSMKNVHIGQPGGKSNLYVNGDIYLGTTKLPVAVDVQVGTWGVGLQGTGAVPHYSAVKVEVWSPLTTVNHAAFLASLAEIHNVSTANDAMWSAVWNGVQPVDKGGGWWEFTVVCAVGDTDGFLDTISWVAVFT